MSLQPNKEAVRWRLRCMCCKQRVTASDALKGHAYFALGGLWHAQHMNCARCRVNVAEIPFCESANEPNVLMCTDCYMAEYNPNCAACGGRLMETAMDAGSGKLYHKDCLRCKACKNPCADGRFMQDDAGAIYDVDCYHILV
ncbi:hypothetical protein PENTCL1PPCAC_10112, partial [Pristionchus entomophagus]